MENVDLIREFPEEDDPGYTMIDKIIAMIRALIKKIFGDIPTAL